MTGDKPQKTLTDRDRAAFAELVRRIQVQNIQLFCSSVKADREFLTGRTLDAPKMEVGLEVSCGAQLVDEGRRLLCDVAFLMKCFVDGESAEVVEIGETYIVSYAVEGSEPVEEKTLQFFASNNATFNVWPFFRASIHATTLRLGLPGYALPLFKPAPERK